MKLTQSPWFLKMPKVCQPPFSHSSFVVGSGGGGGARWRILDLFELGEIGRISRELDDYGGIADGLRLPA